ncbi:uncharacterized protein LOC144066102 [Stigmatopora argus]
MASPSEFTCGKRAAKFHEENSTFCKIIHAKVVLHRIEGLREYLGPDGKESVGLKKELELPQIKEEEPEFPQQQMRDERLPIKKEEDDVTWSLGENLKREEDLRVTSRGAEPAHTLKLPQIKEEEPEFPQQQIKKEKEDVTVSTGEPFKSEDDLGVADRGAETPNGSSAEGYVQASRALMIAQAVMGGLRPGSGAGRMVPPAGKGGECTDAHPRPAAGLDRHAICLSIGSPFPHQSRVTVHSGAARSRRATAITHGRHAYV